RYNRVGDVLLQRVQEILADMWRQPSHNLVHDATERIYVGSRIQRPAHALFGTEVKTGAEDFPSQRQLLSAPASFRGDFGHTEIEDLDHVFTLEYRNNHDVAGLEISVDNAVFVCMG